MITFVDEINGDRTALRRTLTCACQFDPTKARALIGALLCSDAKRDPKLTELAKKHYAQRTPAIDRLHATIVRHLYYAKHETLRNLERRQLASAKPIHAAAGKGGVAADIVFDVDEFADGLLAAVRNDSAQSLQDAGEQFYEEIGRDDPFVLPEPNAVKFLDTRENLLKDVADEVHAEIEDEIQAGLDAGESMSKIAARISDKFSEISKGRGMTIASTETGAAYGYARDVAMKQAGITHKRWLTSHLPTVRPAHAMAEDDDRNQSVPVDEPFKVGGEELLYPGDPAGSAENVINCHCVSLACGPGEDDE